MEQFLLLFQAMYLGCYMRPIEALDMDNPPIFFDAITPEETLYTLEAEETRFWLLVEDEEPETLEFLWVLSDDGPLYNYEILPSYGTVGGSSVQLERLEEYDGQSLSCTVFDLENEARFRWELEVVP